MPLALCTALQFYMIIFSRDARTPDMYITPEVVSNEGVCFLIHSPEGDGHYDCALPAYDFKTVKPGGDNYSKAKSCCCGVNQKLSKDSCKPSPFYTSRCKCFKQSQPCSSLCHCKNCLNPYGRKEERIPPRNSRKKRRHECQVDIPDSKRFAESRGESISMSTWSDFEALVLSEVVKHFSENEECHTYPNITKLYNDIVYYSTSSYCIHSLPPNLVFRGKSINEVTGKIKYMSSHTILNTAQ